MIKCVVIVSTLHIVSAEKGKHKLRFLQQRGKPFDRVQLQQHCFGLHAVVFLSCCVLTLLVWSRLRGAEEAILEAGGIVIRFVGLYHANRYIPCRVNVPDNIELCFLQAPLALSMETPASKT